MAILGKIREKSVFLILIIALGLFAFLIDPTKIIDMFRNGGTKEYLAKVNDEVISSQDFARTVDARKSPNQSTLQVVNQVFDNTVNDILLKEQIEKLGIRVESEQMWDIFKNVAQSSPQFKNENGEFDEGLLKQFLEEQEAANPKAWKEQEENMAFVSKK